MAAVICRHATTVADWAHLACRRPDEAWSATWHAIGWGDTP
jgi:hypothetical protein